jgi:type I restriction-modification system DNA methylase subunit
MLGSDAFHISDPPPYGALPENARQAAIDSISKQGFTSLLEEYSLFSLGENQPVKTNILAFAHPVHRTPEYTGMTVFNAVNGHSDRELVRLLATSAAPFHLIHRDGEFSFWTCPMVDEKPEPVVEEKHISYDQLENVFRKYETDLRPQRIIDVKQGYDTFTHFRNVEPLQLSFWAAEVNGKRLVKHFGSTVESLRASINQRTDISQAEKEILVTTLSIQMLGATVLADTGVLDIDLFGEKEEIRRNRPSLDKLMLRAARKFERYFRSELFIKYISEAQEAYQILREVCFAGFVPDMLRELYKAAYSEQERKESGSYDTPLYLTRQIWKNIPVEYLPPQKRVVVDMTCGWGSFLVAGHERLSNLKDMEGIALRNQLYGNDNSNFTAQLAGLGLLLSTSEDSWNIHNSNALEWQWINTHRPTIIVGNPPFEADRRKANSSEGKKRNEKANQFLKHALDRLAPGGYLSMIMPRSFVAAESSYDLRKQFLEQCDVLELWELPNKVFDATTRTIVLFAQKQEDIKRAFHNPVRVRTIQSHTYEHFNYTKELTFTASELVKDQSSWNEQKRKSKKSKNTHIMDYKTVLSEDDWAKITSLCTNLQNYAISFRGVTRGTPSAPKYQKNTINTEKVNCLFKAKETLKQPFLIDYEKSVVITYPDDLQWPRTQHKEIFEGTKVIVIYTQDPSWGRRAKVAIERKGYYISDDFWVVAPNSIGQREHITSEVLAAVISWDVSNAWIIEHMSSPSIRGRAMQTVPFPQYLSEEDCILLTQAVQQIEIAAHTNQSDSTEANQLIDTILKRAYHLEEPIFARLRQIKEWDNQPEITLDHQPHSDDANCFINGIVDSINPNNGTITLWIKDFDELQTVQIVPSMPGWMLRPDMAFRTEIPHRYVKRGIIDPATNSWGTFRPQPYTYMSEEELLEGFADLLNKTVR